MKTRAGYDVGRGTGNLCRLVLHKQRATRYRRLTRHWRWIMSASILSIILGAGPRSNAQALVGPVYPPPLNVSFSSNDTNNIGLIGLGGGLTLSYSNLALATYQPVYWGATDGGIALSFVSDSFAGTNEIMSFSSASLTESNLVWTGQTVLQSFQYGTVPINTRCRMALSSPWVDATALGLPADVGGVFAGSPTSESWQATLFMEVQDSLDILGEGVDAWVPALSFYNLADAGSPNTNVFSSFSGGFWYSDAIPVITGVHTVSASGGFEIDFTATPGSTNTVLASTNVALPLAQWTPLGIGVNIVSDQFRFIDLSASAYAQRFYRIAGY